MQESDGYVTKKISEIHKGDMVLVYNGKEKRFAKVLDNVKIGGNHEFYKIIMKKINDSEKNEGNRVTCEHIMITFDEDKELKLINAKDLKGNECMDTNDGLYKIYEINKEMGGKKYNSKWRCGVCKWNISFNNMFKRKSKDN